MHVLHPATHYYTSVSVLKYPSTTVVHSANVPAVPEQDLQLAKQLVPVGEIYHWVHPVIVESVHYKQPE